MNTRTYDDFDTAPVDERTTLAAVFADRESARDAIHRLHEDGFGDTWLGLVRGDDAAYGSSPSYGGAITTNAAVSETSEPRVEAENWFSRVFGEGDESLHDALVRHGVGEADAVRAGRVSVFTPNSAILTVDGGNDPDAAVNIITAGGGRLITGGYVADQSPIVAEALPMHDDSSTARAARANAAVGLGAVSGAMAPDNAFIESDDISAGTVGRSTTFDTAASTENAAPLTTNAAAPTTNDEAKRLELREERLRIDKERRARGEATIGKEIVAEQHEIDVPLIREELFIERRPVSGTTAASSAPIGDSELVRIPLTEEQLVVSKSAVVTEEVVIGKRQVTQTGHVSETTRREELTVEDIDTGLTTASGLNGSARI